MRLGGWQRVGIVLSILWVLGAGYLRRDHFVTNAYSAYQTRMEICAKPHLSAIRDDCSKDASRYLQQEIGQDWDSVAITAIAPIPLAWILVYLLAWTWRWVRTGFSSDEKRSN